MREAKHVTVLGVNHFLPLTQEQVTHFQGLFHDANTQWFQEFVGPEFMKEFVRVMLSDPNRYIAALHIDPTIEDVGDRAKAIGGRGITIHFPDVEDESELSDRLRTLQQERFDIIHHVTQGKIKTEGQFYGQLKKWKKASLNFELSNREREAQVVENLVHHAEAENVLVIGATHVAGIRRITEKRNDIDATFHFEPGFIFDHHAQLAIGYQQEDNLQVSDILAARALLQKVLDSTFLYPNLHLFDKRAFIEYENFIARVLSLLSLDQIIDLTINFMGYAKKDELKQRLLDLGDEFEPKYAFVF